ncbi:CBS domain-containing protein, partial [Dactylosporangium sp. NPDC005572]|uniref:CBS domain-containing protein n=1 Tax=Dactylosporangium sp. NPDC005572 TaxID=3156889 RepID=UPI0033BB44F9
HGRDPAHALAEVIKYAIGARAKAAACTAAGLMTAPAVVAAARTPVTAAARMMAAAGVKRVPVVDDDHRLVGIASRRDLLTVFLRPDEAIRHEIVRGVLETLLWIAPTEVTVDVRHGVVYLDGDLDRRSLVESVAGMVRAVDGVVDVVSRLTYRTDDTGRDRGG